MGNVRSADIDEVTAQQMKRINAKKYARMCASVWPCCVARKHLNFLNPTPHQATNAKPTYVVMLWTDKRTQTRPERRCTYVRTRNSGKSARFKFVINAFALRIENRNGFYLFKKCIVSISLDTRETQQIAIMPVRCSALPVATGNRNRPRGRWDFYEFDITIFVADLLKCRRALNGRCFIALNIYIALTCALV